MTPSIIDPAVTRRLCEKFGVTVRPPEPIPRKIVKLGPKPNGGRHRRGDFDKLVKTIPCPFSIADAAAAAKATRKTTQNHVHRFVKAGVLTVHRKGKSGIGFPTLYSRT